MNKETFILELKKLNIDVTDEKINQLDKYYELLIEWNEKINLTAITEKEQVYLKHFYDSLTLSKIIDLNKDLTLCDIGTGAGFPGLVLKIFYPNLKVTLVDALNKRINFLKLVIAELNLKDIEVVHSRMEDYTNNHVEKFDIVTARAVAHLSNLMEYSIKSVKINGKLIFMKGDLKEELKESENACNILKVKLDNILEFKLPIEDSSRTLISLEKISSTPNKYPRKYAEIKKQRL